LIRLYYKQQNMFELYLVTDEKLCLGKPLAEVVELAVIGGVTAVQLREKNLNTRDFIQRAVQLKKILSAYHVPLIINDRIDIALAAGADGIHVGQKDLPYEYFNKIIPDQMLRGLSVETPAQAGEAEEYRLDYLSVSPVFLTSTKTELKKEWGIEGLRELAATTKHPLVAIGGINSSNAGEIVRAGAKGIAVVSAICSARDPLTAARELKSIIEKTKKEND
jgi:thiamine-phosphate pyrophosphorylase